MSLPSYSLLRGLLTYDPKTGELLWNYRPGNRSFNMRDAGTPALQTPMKNGYLCGRISGKTYYAHRVIWKWMTGQEPEFIDHINHDRADNRWENLRNVAKAENCKNVKRGSRNTSGVVGVRWDYSREKWVAQIKVTGKGRHLGYYDSFKRAVSVRKRAEAELGFHKNHGA